MNFDFNKTSKNIKVITIKTIKKLKHFFTIKMKSKFESFKKIFKKFISKKNLISKSENIKTKFEKRIRILKSLIKNLYKVFFKNNKARLIKTFNFIKR